MWADVSLVLGAYLLGAFPALYLLGRLKGLDIKKEDDMHLTLWRRGGRLLGIIGLIWDIVKGMIPVAVAKIMHFEPAIVAGAGLAAVLGQMWSVFLQFNGEKGNSTGMAMAVVLAPIAFLPALVPLVAGLAIRTVPRLLDSRQSVNERLKLGGPPSRSLPLGMLVVFAVLPFSAWLFGEPFASVLAFFLLFIAVMLKRLTAGLTGDLKAGGSRRSILTNRLLYDRSYL